MTTSNAPPVNGPESAVQPAVDFCSTCLERGGEQVQALMNGMKELTDPAALRRGWLDMVGGSLDCYMRTPAFLDAMRRNFEVATQLKTISEAWAGAFSSVTGLPRIWDIGGLFERMKIGQEAILSRLDALDRRLSALEGKRKRHDD